MTQINPVIKDAHYNCHPEKYLEYGDLRYIRFDDWKVRGTGGDVMEDIHTALSLARDLDPARIVFTGFRGCGKTTELKRLEKFLNDDGFAVVYVDTDQYLNLTVPATVTDLWIAIAAGVNDYLEEHAISPGAIGRFWERLSAFLNREVELLKAKVSIPEIAELQMTLKDNPTLREKINRALAEKQPALVEECRDFVRECQALIVANACASSGMVLIVDSFEKLSNNSRDAEAVRASAVDLFQRDWPLLKAPCHAIYTVPPWLAFTGTGANLGFVYVLPMCKVAEKDGTDDTNGILAMREFLAKRMNLEAIFGNAAFLDKLILMSGGYPRDLLRMIREILLRSAHLESLPIPEDKLKEDVDRVVTVFVEQYGMGLNGDDLPMLAHIALTQDLEEFSREDKFILAELFDHHFVLSYQNGERWFNLHPLLRATKSVTRAIEASLKASRPKTAGMTKDAQT